MQTPSLKKKEKEEKEDLLILTHIPTKQLVVGTEKQLLIYYIVH